MGPSKSMHDSQIDTHASDLPLQRLREQKEGEEEAIEYV